MQSDHNSLGTVEAAGVLDCDALARTLRELLALRYPPVALAFVDSAPEGVDEYEEEVPSACTFWRRCEEQTFYASAEAHRNCPIGLLTMGFTMSEPQRGELMELVGTMGEIGYVGADEAANIPSVPGEKSGVVYGPLATFPADPDAVLVWVSGSAAMLLDEATGASRWTPESTGTASFGRPSCAAIAAAITRQAPTFSVGCTGMRTFTEIDASLGLAVLPKPVLDDLHERLEMTARANDQMGNLYAEAKRRFSGGEAASPQGA